MNSQFIVQQIYVIMASMNTEEALAELKALTNERIRTQNIKDGAGDNQFGVRLGDIRKLAKKIRIDRELAMALWETGNIDARFLAILLIKVQTLSTEEVERMLRSIGFLRVADWFNAYIVRKHPDNETLRQKWMSSDHPMLARASWDLTTERVAKDPAGMDIPALLNRIESEMGNAASEVQWTMNFSLAAIGIHFSEHRERAIAIGESLGIYRDYPVSKGCTSPFAPIWIREMVSRQG